MELSLYELNGITYQMTAEHADRVGAVPVDPTPQTPAVEKARTAPNKARGAANKRRA